MRSGSNAKVLANRKLKYYRISECAAHLGGEAGVLKVWADDVPDLPNLCKRLLEALVQLERAVNPEGAI